jgi:hypothetical protein
VGTDLKRYGLYLYWIRKRKLLLSLLSLGLILSGAIIIGIGVFFYYSYAYPPTFSSNPYYEGFGTGQNGTVTPTSMLIELTVFPPTLYFQYNFVPLTSGVYNFIFVFPFDIKGDLPTRSLGGSILKPENMTFNFSNSGTAISLSLNLTKMVGDTIWGNFNIAQTFLSGKRGLYTIVLPFYGGVGNVGFQNIAQNLGTSFYNPIPEVDLYVILPHAYSSSETFPPTSGMNSVINFLTNKPITSLSWTFDDSGNSVNSVSIQCEDQSEIGYYGNSSFLSGIFIGVGSSILITSAYDGLKKLSENAEKYIE